ncbi:signal transduction histidine kinase [Isoptericola jiangsuensis]|uniref:histidine kinase n=1 Tax=Isoptericola jiangsuensis TaxID=548579 RepID=A0A2A9F0Z7_9MICO|nr:histidine kinase [Isoptericola jiangsuensis]PFG44099.1 signal transduction histidine kinase [Isoptericola jiangsuensis]
MGWYGRVVRWSEQHPFVLDATGAAVLLLFVGITATDLGGADRGPAVVLWSIATVAPLAWRRVRPVLSAVAVYACALGHLLAGFPLLLPADVAVLVALYSVTVWGPRWAHRTAMASTVLGCLLLAAVVGLAGGPATLGFLALLPVTVFLGSLATAVWAFGLTRRYRRVTVETLRDRARRLEVERDQQARIATAAERARIAREMHDIVAHSLSIVVAQADGGRYAAGQDPAAATRALGVISETGRAALADMRRLLGVLRDDPAGGEPAPGATGRATLAPGPGPTGPGGAGPTGPVPAGAPRATTSGAPLAPQPDDADLETVVAQAKDAGAHVSLVRVGTPRRLPPGAGLTLHRVAQEALSNVRKHAGPDPRVTVVVRWEPEAVVLEVSDDGRGAAAGHDSPGFGLLGMRERAALFGGSVTAGPRPGGGWRVRFTMPLPGVAPAPEAGPAPADPPPAAGGGAVRHPVPEDTQEPA